MRVVTFEQECTELTTYESEIVALEDSINLCVQFSGTDLPIDVDADITVYASNDGVNWGAPGDFGSTATNGMTIRNNMNNGFVPMYNVANTGARFIKIVIDVLTEPSAPYTIKVDVCIKE